MWRRHIHTVSYIFCWGWHGLLRSAVFVFLLNAAVKHNQVKPSYISLNPQVSYIKNIFSKNLCTKRSKKINNKSITKTFNNIINFYQLTSLTSLNALSKLSLIAKLLFSMSPRKFLLERKLLSTKNVDKAFRASTISCQITSDHSTLSQFFTPQETHLGVKMLLPCHCLVWFLRSCLISSITGYLVGIRSLPPSWKYTWLNSTRTQGPNNPGYGIFHTVGAWVWVCVLWD